MKKRFYVLLILNFSAFFFINLNAKAQITLTTQAQVDAFNQTSVAGNLTIFSSSITNLNGLSELQSIGGVLEITNTAITNVDGLSSLQSADKLFIRGNSLLANLNGFSGLTTVPLGFRFENNRVLTNFNGLQSITGIIEGIYISDCPMTNLNGFSSIPDVTGFLEFESNPFLANIDGLAGLAGTYGVNSIKIIDNPLLQDINGLLGIKNANGITIKGNSTITGLNGLSNLKAVRDIIIESNSHLANINGLSGITAMSGSLWIRRNSLLTNIDGVSELTSLGKELLIDVNPALTNIDGLSKLTSIGTNLIFATNSHLVNVDGLQNLIAVGNDLKITTNIALVDFCGLFKLFDQGTIGGIVEIKNNGANTVAIVPPPDIVLNNDPGLCSKDISSVVPTPATVIGCLKPGAPGSSGNNPFNIYPVGTTNITWSVTDGAGNTATATQKIIIIDNEIPVITQFPADATVQCAADVSAANIASVSATDNCPDVTITHVGDVITNQTCANRYTLTRTYKATDGSGNTATRSQTITVNDNVPPQINGLTASKQILSPPNHKMVDIEVEYTVTDNCVSSPNYTINVTSNEPINGTGDGDTDPDWEIIDDHHIRLRAERSANGDGRIYTITVTANDGCNAPVSASTQVVVAHNITSPHSGQPFRVGSSVSFSGTFWDIPVNKHSAKWIIDENTTVKGSVTEPTANKNGKVTASYKFNSPGVYKLQMNVTDQNGLTNYVNTNGDLDAIIVIYDPNGGYTYGGGYFNSQAGALTSNPTSTGKASYGFAMNYFKNSTNPKGETQFEFKVGDFEFNALNFDYLVIDRSMAQFKGTGKIAGGQSGIGFIMTVVDGQLDGTGKDKIRMKIYNRNTGEVIYDNQPGASDAALPIQAVGLNSEIVINGINSSLTQSNNKTQVAEMEVTVLDVSNKFNVIAYPNPSSNSFSIRVSGESKQQISMLVMDMYGRVIETRNVIANSTTKFGDRYITGTYFVRIVQGKEHKEIKLVKLPN